MSEHKYCITCPATREVICEYSYEMNLPAVVDAHTKKFHPEWKRKTTLVYLPSGGVECPICTLPVVDVRALARHVGRMHKEYEKVDTMEWRLRREDI